MARIGLSVKCNPDSRRRFTGVLHVAPWSADLATVTSKSFIQAAYTVPSAATWISGSFWAVALAGAGRRCACPHDAPAFDDARRRRQWLRPLPHTFCPPNRVVTW